MSGAGACFSGTERFKLSHSIFEEASAHVQLASPFLGLLSNGMWKLGTDKFDGWVEKRSWRLAE
jgi:hypothetical protein